MHDEADRAGPDDVRLVVRTWLPDRPGALGLVASRIGATGADIIGIDVLERSDHVAVDEFAIVLPRADLVKLLVREIEEVDGVSVEECRLVDRFPDARLDALETVEQLAHASERSDLALRLVTSVLAEFEATWSAVVQGAEILASVGSEAPNAAMLEALVAGTSASASVAAGESGPEDLAVAPLEHWGASLLVGRDGHPFRRRERRQLLALGRIADRIASLLR